MTQPDFDRWWELFLARLDKKQKESEPPALAGQDPPFDWDADFETWTDEELAQLALQF